MVGTEAWLDYRRTGLPALTPGPNAALHQLPVRIQYPDDEQVLNAANYQAVISAQGADEITTETWLTQDYYSCFILCEYEVDDLLAICRWVVIFGALKVSIRLWVVFYCSCTCV